MAVLGKDLLDIDRPVTHTKVLFGEEHYWIEENETPIAYGEILTQILNYDLTPYAEAMRRYQEGVERMDCPGVLLAQTQVFDEFWKLPFYERFGFVSEGESASQHGGAVWYQMRLNFAAFYKSCIMKGEETHVILNGEKCQLYGWEQCDGYVLNLADAQGEIIWQTPPMTHRECADAFLAAMEKQSGFA